MRPICSKLKGALSCAAFLAAAATCGWASAAESASSCKLPQINLWERPLVDGAPTKVALGFFLIDIIDIDDVEQEIKTEFEVFQTWTDPRLTGLDECRFDLSQVWSPDLTFVNSGRVFPAFPERVAVGPKGVVRYVQRYRGSLSFPHALQNFPFDAHTIQIALIPMRQDRHADRLEVDKEHISRQGQFTILDWTFGDVSARIVPTTHPVTGETADVFYFEIPTTRLYQYYLWKVFMPLTLIAAMSWSVFWVNPAKFGPQIGMSATSMLTLIAFQFAVESILPRLSYFTLLDGFSAAATGLVFLGLVESLATSYLVSIARAELAVRIDRVCRWAFPLAFTAIVVWIFGI
jgi:hypothetical protein